MPRSWTFEHKTVTNNKQVFWKKTLNPKRLDGRLLAFRKMYLLKRGWNPGFFVTFKNPGFFVIVSLSIWAIFIDFHQFFLFFDIFFLQRN